MKCLRSYHCYFVSVSAEYKTPDLGPPHYPEDEGLYVGEKPPVLWTNQVAMENRLLRREDKVRHVQSRGYVL